MNKRIYLYSSNHRLEAVFRRLKDSGVKATAFVDKSKKATNIINSLVLLCFYIK